MPFRPHFVSSLGEALPALAAQLAEPTGDLFTRELLVVPSLGVQQWLTERLATVLGARSGGADGIVASIDFVYPGALVARVLGQPAAGDPWSVERLTIALLDVIAADPTLVPAGRLRDGPLPAARRIADLFDRYHFHRADMMRRWAEREPVLQEVDDEPEPALPAACRWQYDLWCAVHDRLGPTSPPERARAALERLRGTARPDAVPARCFIVGVTALPAQHLELLQALGRHAAVQCWIAHPSPGLLQRTAARLAAVRSARRVSAARHPVRQLAHLPQLDSWTRPSQGMQVLLAGSGGAVDMPAQPSSASMAQMTLLQRMQYALRADEPPTGAPAVAADHSLQLHRCHGLARQCEVLRELLLHTFRELPDLDPRDVLIVAPDIAAVAPHLDGVFPQRAPGAAPDPLALPVRVADRSLTTTNEVAQVLSLLLALPSSRVGIRELRDLTAVPAVQRALDVDDATLALWFGWAGALRVRWGLTAEQRTRYGLPGNLRAHTWRHALQRLVTGAVMPTAAPRAELPPYAPLPARGVEVGELPSIGAFARLLRLLIDFVDAAERQRPVAAWCDLLLDLVDQLADLPRESSAQKARIQRLLGQVRADAARSSTPVSFEELRVLVSPALGGDPGRVFLRSGRITATSLVPLRGVPYRVVCLVGLDDGALTAGDGDGDDLLRVQPVVGDPDPRGEQRQSLLDALLQAGERLLITCTGFDPRNNAAVEPITPLSELLDLVRTVGGRPEAITVDHPRHAADPRNFQPGTLGREGPFGHLAAHRHAATLLGPGRVSSAVQVTDRGLDATMPPQPIEIPASDLVLLLDNPLELYVKRTLGIDVYESDGDAGATLPTEVARKDYAAAAAELLEVVRGAPLDPEIVARAAAAWRARIGRRGVLPPLALGDEELHRAADLVSELQRQAALRAWPLTVGGSEEVRIPVCGGTRWITTSLSGLQHAAESPRLLRVFTERNTDTEQIRQRIDTWLLALHRSDVRVDSAFLGQHKEKSDKSFCRTGAVVEGTGVPQLADAMDELVGLYDEALRHPRPVFQNTGAGLLRSRNDALEAFAEFCRRPLAAYRAEARLYGSTPDFDAVFADEGIAPFVQRWITFRDWPVSVTTSKASTARWPRSDKPAGTSGKGRAT